MEAEEMIEESLAIYNNYLYTGQTERAVELMAQLDRTIVDGSFAYWIVRKMKGLDTGEHDIVLEKFFGKHWTGEDLTGKSIEIFCDQGMGDVLNMLRYIRRLKEKYGCWIALNCYAHYDALKRIVEDLEYVEEFVDYHIKCDYHSNIFSIPLILEGIRKDIPYPAHFEILLNQGLPYQPPLNISAQKRKMRVGVAWKSNAANTVLAEMKSMDLSLVERLVDERYELWSLLPEETGAKFLIESELNDLYDTAQLMTKLDAIVSVDTVVLHLAGAMFKKTYAILCKDHDPRWPRMQHSNFSMWYEGCYLFVQKTAGDWSHPLEKVKQQLDHQYKEMDEIGFLNGAATGGLY